VYEWSRPIAEQVGGIGEFGFIEEDERGAGSDTHPGADQPLPG
jgi:hypothetical protein